MPPVHHRELLRPLRYWLKALSIPSAVFLPIEGFMWKQDQESRVEEPVG
jgi:hypothetical protein